MTVFLTDLGEHTIEAHGGARVSPGDAETITGWTLKPQGMCRGDQCVPLPPETHAGGAVDLAAFWRLLGNPVVSDPTGDVWVLGPAAETRAAALDGLEAPDFTLPDHNGSPLTLSSFRGSKVLLTTWASW